MSLKLTLSGEDMEDVRRLGHPVRSRILSKLDWLRHNSDNIAHYPLSAGYSCYFKLRIGDYRAIYSLDLEPETILVVAIRHRSEAYKP